MARPEGVLLRRLLGESAEDRWAEVCVVRAAVASDSVARCP
jgi:hypothetical protein